MTDMHIRLIGTQEFHAKVADVSCKKGKLTLKLELGADPTLAAGLIALQNEPGIRIRVEPESLPLPFEKGD